MAKEQIVITLSKSHRAKLFQKMAAALTGTNPECLRPGTIARRILENALDTEFPDEQMSQPHEKEEVIT